MRRMFFNQMVTIGLASIESFWKIHDPCQRTQQKTLLFHGAIRILIQREGRNILFTGHEFIQLANRLRNRKPIPLKDLVALILELFRQPDVQDRI